jgi:uncharacterized protein (DUF58 family)
MVDHLRRLARRHVGLCVAMADADLDREAWSETRDVRGLGRAVAARELLAERAAVFERLRRAGVQCIDAPWQRVDTALLQRYLDIQRRELVG